MFAAGVGVKHARPAGAHVDFEFDDGTAYRFHSLWLRDACRDAAYVSAAAGERLLAHTAVAMPQGTLDELRAVQAHIGDDGESVQVEWSDSSSPASHYSSVFLRCYADRVAKPLAGSTDASPTKNLPGDWLLPYCGVAHAKAPSISSMDLWSSKGENLDLTYVSYNDLSVDTNLELMQALLRDGVVIIKDMPAVQDASALLDTCSQHIGALQKDPAREEANWRIVKKENAQSISYNQDARLMNHTDQSIPSHGTVGLLLAVHYLDGHGHNTMVDGIAVAEALRKRDPEAFEILTRFPVDAERDYIASRVDSGQTHTDSLLISTKYPVIQTDAHGAVRRVQYNEVFRTPATMAFDDFQSWYRAFKLYVDMLHSPEFERLVPMRAGELLLLQNWRILHGRAGYQSPNRTLVGGTITRENFYSKACQLLCQKHDLEPYQLHLQHASSC